MHIKANCTGAENLKIEDFNELQGNLKEISRDHLDRLRTSILTYGIIYPFHAWRDDKGKVWTIDAHQRTKAIKELLKAGHTYDYIPTTFIKAKSKKDAAEKLLVLNSKYAQITEIGLAEFTTANDIDLSALDNILDIDIEPTPAAASELSEIAIKEIETKPFEKSHILFSYPPEMHSFFQEMIETAREMSKEIEIEIGSN